MFKLSLDSSIIISHLSGDVHQNEVLATIERLEALKIELFFPLLCYAEVWQASRRSSRGADPRLLDWGECSTLLRTVADNQSAGFLERLSTPGSVDTESFPGEVLICEETMMEYPVLIHTAEEGRY